MFAALLGIPGSEAVASNIHLSWDGDKYQVAFEPHTTPPVTSIVWNSATANGTSEASPAPRPPNDDDRVYVGSLPPHALNYTIGEHAYEIKAPPAPNESVRVAFLADMGTSDDAWRVWDAIAREKPDLIIIGGDIAYANGRPETWDDWFTRAQPLAATTPIMTAFGNHEGYCEDISGTFRTCARETLEYMEHFPMPNAPRRYYAFDWGPARFTALDSEAYHEPKGIDTPWTDPGEQASFLDESLASRPTTWKIVYLHRPLYTSNTRAGPDLDAQRDLLPILEWHGTALVLAGHAHAYERTYPLRGAASVVGNDSSRPDDGVVHVTSGGGGESNYDEWRPQPRSSARRSAEPEFLLLDITPAAIHGRALRPDGSILDEFRIIKSLPGESSSPSPTDAPRATPGVTLLAALCGSVLALTLRRRRNE